jgi:SAM-dependent methyltransferase
VSQPSRISLRQHEIDRTERDVDDRSTIAFYENDAAEYARATRSISLAAEIQWFSQFVPASARVLDVGCGSGRDLVALKRAGMRPIGLELSARLAAIARDYSECQVVEGDMRNPPFADAAFDGIWAAASLLHLNRADVGRTLWQLHRLLVPGGTLFASMKVGLGAERTPDGRLFSYFLPEEWSGLLGAAGFLDVELRTEIADNAETPASVWIQSLARIAS